MWQLKAHTECTHSWRHFLWSRTVCPCREAFPLCREVTPGEGEEGQESLGQDLGLGAPWTWLGCLQVALWLGEMPTQNKTQPGFQSDGNWETCWLDQMTVHWWEGGTGQTVLWLSLSSDSEY